MLINLKTECQTKKKNVFVLSTKIIKYLESKLNNDKNLKHFQNPLYAIENFTSQ